MGGHHKLSFWTAVLVNLNVMFGAGIFINTISVAKQAGFLGFISYLVVAILLIPLIIGMSRLIALFPNGGFYGYGAHTISKGVGFFSAWAYFTGKLASAALLVHVFSTLIVSLFPGYLGISTIALDSIIICLFAWLNLHHMKTGRAIMYTFMVFKVVPILFAILSCLYLYSYWSVPADLFLWSGIPYAIPLVIFAFTGFEVCCSLSSSIENAQKNGPRIIFLTYGLVVCTTIIYQFFMFLTAGSSLMGQESYLGVFPTLLSLLFADNSLLVQHGTHIIHVAIACASLGGSYGILFSNHWNLYALAEHNHTFFPQILTTLNSYSIPFYCILVEAILCIFYLVVTQASVVILQQISVMGSVLAYTMSMVGLLYFSRTQDSFNGRYIIWGALLSCLLFISCCVRNFYYNGLYAFYFFTIILIFGIGMYLITKKKGSA